MDTNPEDTYFVLFNAHKMISSILYRFPPFLVIIISFYLFYLLHFQQPSQSSNHLSSHFIKQNHKSASNLLIRNQTDRFAFATLVTPAFAMGAVVLGYQLQKFHGDKYDRICIISEDVNTTWRKILSQWWDLVPVKEYRPMTHFRRSWMKLYVFDMDQYKKIVYLDTDIFVVKPLDALFNYPQLSCVPDVNPPQICNTGVLVIEPKKGTFDAIDDLARVKLVRMGIGDQSSINAFFSKFTPLPPEYNTPRTHESGLGYLLNLNKSRLIHFVCKKPWKCGRDASGMSTCGCGYYELNRAWWEEWDNACKDHMCMESWLEFKPTKKPKPTKKR